MKIIECCPFYNENLVADIHASESAKWVDEIHILESNRTFQYGEKDYFFSLEHPKVKYHQVDVINKFRKNRKYLPYLDLNKRHSNHGFYRRTSWYNEQVQRNLALELAGIADDDIVILSDIDEILDARFAEKIVSDVLKYGIITVKLHFTVFYLNLFSRNWGGPPNYSYRIFIATGKKIREDWNYDSDLLRKAGESGKLFESVYCSDEIMGFHHSWLGEEKWISEKLAAYAHTEHKNLNDLSYIHQCLSECKSIFPDHELFRDENISLLDSVDKFSGKYGRYLL